MELYKNLSHYINFELQNLKVFFVVSGLLFLYLPMLDVGFEIRN